MAKRGQFFSDSELGKKELLEELKTLGYPTENPVVETSKETATIVYIRSIYSSVIKYKGQVTGQPYVWNRAGDVIGVDEKDAPYLLAKRIGGKGCCGAVNRDGNKLFEKA